MALIGLCILNREDLKDREDLKLLNSLFGGDGIWQG
jgi:hypothetical protein